jgi:hypothetical protein
MELGAKPTQVPSRKKMSKASYGAVFYETSRSSQKIKDNSENYYVINQEEIPNALKKL